MRHAPQSQVLCLPNYTRPKMPHITGKIRFNLVFSIMNLQQEMQLTLASPRTNC